MINKIKSMLDDERGVSPVIGVILMVAITVILAAVIGTFVLGLGDSLNQAPQSQLNAEATGSETSEVLEISHNGGDAIDAGDIRITVDGDSNSPFTNDSFAHSGGTFSVGDTITVDSFGGNPDGSTQVQVIHVPSESIILDTEVEFSEPA